MMGRVDTSDSGGTNDSDGIQMMLNMIREKGNADALKTIVVISDGEGKTEEVKKLVAQAEEEGLKIIGVGIGDGMSSVEKAYNEHVSVPDISQLPTDLCEIIRKQIENASGG